MAFNICRVLRGVESNLIPRKRQRTCDTIAHNAFSFSIFEDSYKTVPFARWFSTIPRKLKREPILTPPANSRYVVWMQSLPRFAFLDKYRNAGILRLHKHSALYSEMRIVI